jgi:aminoglycoside phosphotransferase (APT) family kinase protein
MSEAKLHPDEIASDAALVRRLLGAQLPRWAELPIERVPSAGTENALYRLGDDKVVRMPLRPGDVTQIDKLARFLPRLAPLLPLEISLPLAQGAPTADFPHPWSVYRWLDGGLATRASIADLGECAATLARFVAALQRIDAADGPRPGRHNFFRGIALSAREEWTRRALGALRGRIDTEAASAAWEAALAVPVWHGAPVWIHGDIKSGNLLAVEGRLRAVIDWGGLGVGDPAVDLLVAWNLLDAKSRRVFRAELGVDDATWARGRGWALSVALLELPYYWDTNPEMIAEAQRVLAELAADPD